MSTPIRDRRIIAYKVLRTYECTDGLDDFNERATKLIEEGFQPYGEPLIKQPPGSRYMQAFVKYEENANE